MKKQGEDESRMEKLYMENREINMEEEWIKINCCTIPEGEFIVSSFIQDLDGTKIVLNDEIFEIEIFFDGLPVLSRNAVEGIRMRTWGEVQLKYDDKRYFRKSFLFEVKKSKLVQWCIEESCGFYEENQLKHYCIVTSEEIIDVVSTFEPKIKITHI